MFKSRHHTGAKDLVANFERNQVIRNMGARPLRTVVSSKLGKHGYSFHIYIPKQSYFMERKLKCGPAPSLKRAMLSLCLSYFRFFVPRRWGLEYIPSIGVAAQ